MSGVTFTIGTDHFDSHTGTAAALIAAGIVTEGQLTANQRGGRAVFMPDGSPQPKGLTACRLPGFKEVVLLAPDSYRVNVTVSADEQERRLESKSQNRPIEAVSQYAADEAERQRVADIAKPLEHWFGEWCEEWRGTKTQLQAAGIGVGLAFPGEPGAPAHVETQDAAGYKLVISTGLYGRSDKPLPGHRFSVSSQYVESPPEPEAPAIDVAPGVTMKEGFWTNVYAGSAGALTVAGFVRLDQLPGQPMRGKTRCSYYADGSPVLLGSPKRARGGLTVEKRGKGLFVVSIDVGEEEQAKRRRAWDAHRAAEKDAVAAARDARIEERNASKQVRVCPTVETFRAKKLRLAEAFINMIRTDVFNEPAGIFSFQIGKDDDERDDLADAFQTIRDAISTATVVKDKKLEAAATLTRNVKVAKTDPAFRAFMQRAQSDPGQSAH